MAKMIIGEMNLQHVRSFIIRQILVILVINSAESYEFDRKFRVMFEQSLYNVASICRTFYWGLIE